MALKPVRYTSKDFDHFVNVLIGRWEDAVDMQSQWPRMDEDEQAFQTEDWPVNNDIHQHLVDYVVNHELTKDQKTQWARLNELVAEHKKDLEEMGYRVLVPDTAKGKEAA
ncbi:MAG: hypothetical protein HYY30_08005 [Chloroflexi bacterium]|nr:hypothetical protein [Chloroflexota bacterium]